MNPSTSTATVSSPAVDSILQAYEHAEAGRYADALMTIKTAKGADSKNIYIIALERQFTKLLSLPRNQAASKQQQAEIMESLPSLLERAITAARQHAQSESTVMQSGSTRLAERDAKLAALKKQYFDHADEYVQKGEYEHALAEIRRVIILDPDNRVAKEYEQKIMQLAVRQSQRAPSSASSKAPSGKMPSGRVPSGYTPGSSSRHSAPSERALSSTPAYEADAQPASETVKTKKSSKTPMLLAALIGVLIVAGGGVYFMMNRPDTGGQPVADAGTQSVQQQTTTPASTPTEQQTAPQQAAVQQPVSAPSGGTTPQITQPPVQEQQVVKSPASTPANRATTQPAAKERQSQQQRQQPPQEKPKQTQQAQQQPALAANTSQPASTPATTNSAPAQPATSAPATQDDNSSSEPFVPVEKQPQIIKLERPKLPSLALQGGMEAKVVVKVQIDPQGKPLQAVIVSSSNEVFNDAVIEAVMKSKFAPGMMTTGPVTSWLAIPFKFNKGK